MSTRSLPRLLRSSGVSALGVAGSILVVTGLVLGFTLHIGFLALLALGAFGPGTLRQLGLVQDQDELQRQAAARAGHSAFLATGVFAASIVIARQWGTLRLGEDLVPASLVLALLLVVYGASYLLSFWDLAKAARVALLAAGVFWFAFAALSHASEPLVALVEGGTIGGPLLLAALCVRHWPRLVGFLLLALSVVACIFFGLVPFEAGVPAQRLFGKLFVLVLLPLPLAALGLRLVVRVRDTTER